ncbi:MAG: helix-turn-helix domain-containing protein [Polyangia bacterium]
MATSTGTTLYLQNRYTRLMLAPGLVGWIYEYRNRETLHKNGAVATGLELGVQLRGEWRHRGSLTPERLYGPGAIHTISPSETYDLSFSATGEVGVQVGFILYPDEVGEYARLPGELRFAPGAATEDPRFLALCRELHHLLEPESAGPPAADLTLPLPLPLPLPLIDQVQGEVRRFIERSCELLPHDPLLLAKRELERNLAQPLYLHHLAEVAGMHPTTFSRRFAQRIGLTPIRYRLLLRLNEAARLTWARADLSIPAIASAVGFDDPVYFYRAFKQQFGMTPAQYGRRVTAVGSGERG